MSQRRLRLLRNGLVGGAILAALAVTAVAVTASYRTRGVLDPELIALTARLATVRNAIELYAAEHAGRYPGPDATSLRDGLTTYTDVYGQQGTRADAHLAFRRYLVEIPACPVGENADGSAASRVLISHSSPPAPDPTFDAGWVYNPETGEFVANTHRTDAGGRAFHEY